MADIYSLSIRADTTDIKRANQDLGAMSGQATKASKSTQLLEQRTNRLGRAAGASTSGLRGVSMQLSQVAQQGALTGNYLQALAIQLPDLALGFGPVGIALGAVAGGLFSFITATQDAEEETKTFIERIEGLELAYSDLNAEVRTALELERARKAEQFRQQIEEQEKALRDAVTTQQAYNNVMKAGSAEAARFGGGITPEKLAASQEAAKEARGEMGLLKLELEALNDRYDDYLDGSAAAAAADEERREKLDRLVETIKAQGETVGMTARETALYEAARLGANEADLAAIRNSFDLIEAGRRQQEAQKALMDATKISVKDDPLLQRIEAEKRGQEILLEQQRNYTQARKSLDQSLLSSASSTAGALASTIGELAGEQSAAYRAAFLAQQGFAIASAIVSTQMAAAAALAPPPIGLGPVAGAPYAATIEAIGAANVAIIAAQTIGGLAQSYSGSPDGARQMGGSVSAGGRYLVGENGPEVVTMGGSGVVTPSSLEGGGDTYIEIIDQSTGNKTYSQETMTDESGMRKTRIMIRDMMREDIQKGEFDRQMQTSYGVKRQARRV